MNHNAYLYSFANEKENYRPVEYRQIDLATSTVDSIQNEAIYMACKSENIKSVYLVPPRPNLAHEFHKAFKNPTIEECIAFRDYIESIGIRVV